MKQKVKFIVLLVSFAAVLGGSWMLYRSLTGAYDGGGYGEQAAQRGGVKGEEEQKRVEAPDFTVFDANGKKVSLSDFRGMPVVLNFWASWCPPCKAEMPEFDQMAKELDGKVVFLMVNMTDGARETKEKAGKFIAQQGFSFPVYYDEGQAAAYAYGITALPTTCFIDRRGLFVRGIRGGISGTELRRNISLIYP